MLRVYNSLTRKKENFVPLKPNKVAMYVCGITVYDKCHLGHARSMVSFDVIVRYLRHLQYDVNYVRNITDIDDKIITRANQVGQNINDLTAKYITVMHNDCKALGLLSPDSEPRATYHMEEIITLIKKLIERNYAYITASGDVCFEVARFKDYGKLAHKDLEGLISGMRVESDELKRSPLDFVLWKQAKANEPAWSSPWGEGRPGWHIECSAMSMELLGEQFDIHGGGFDLQFPHHENEIAQSEAASGKRFANYWLHVGLLQVNNEKMAKSLGNFFTIEEVLKDNHSEVVRYFLISSHYRSPVNYSKENLNNALSGLQRLYIALKDVKFNNEPLDSKWMDLFNEAMDDDFNTPEALAVLFQLARELNKTKSPILAKTLKTLGNLLGLLNDDDFLQAKSDLEKEEIERLIAERNEARAQKHYAIADEIRQRLAQSGIEIEDHGNNTSWRVRGEKN